MDLIDFHCIGKKYGDISEDIFSQVWKSMRVRRQRVNYPLNSVSVDQVSVEKMSLRTAKPSRLIWKINLHINSI